MTKNLSKIELRVGTILKVDQFPKARNPSYKIQVDFGKLGIRKTSAQLPLTYPIPEELIGKQVIGVCNFPRKNIAGFMSEFLCVGFPNADAKVNLMNTHGHIVNNGQRIGLFADSEDSSPPDITFAEFEEAQICIARVVNQNLAESSCLLDLDCGIGSTISVEFPKLFANQESLPGSYVVYCPQDNTPLFVDNGNGLCSPFGVDREHEVSPGAKLY